MASESTVQRVIWAGLARRSKLFRTNSGKAWLSGGGPVVHMPNGSVVVPFARPMGLGLAMVNGDTVPGLSDLTGYTLVTITAAMVGRVIPVFTTLECKESGGGRKAANQKHFIQQVLADGGIAGFASSLNDAIKILDDWLSAGAPS